jgi:hypothetical protein
MMIIHQPNQHTEERNGEGERFAKKLLGPLAKVQPYISVCFFSVQTR